MRILCDIGGTYARFGTADEGRVNNIQKYEAADFPDLQSALAEYTKGKTGTLKIATVAYSNGDVWRFINQNKWVISPADLEKEGWDIEVIMNDFEAATYALLKIKDEDLETLQSGKGAATSKCILGPGTGLGLGYLHGNQVQKTHGGHMPIASLNDEHGKIIKQIRSLQDKAVVFEDIVSGPGFFKLKELCDEQTALRLFHEFLGIFAATAVITGNTYGGLYLTGGVIERLIEDNKFDPDTFLNAFHCDVASSVKEALEATPVYHITDPYPALKGLLNA